MTDLIKLKKGPIGPESDSLSQSSPGSLHSIQT